MWYSETHGIPDDILATGIHEIGPGYDALNVPMEERAVVLWKGPKGRVNHDTGYLFASREALRSLSLNPMVLPVNGKQRIYNIKPAGCIGEPGGYVPPGCPATYQQTPVPNRLHVYILTAAEPSKPLPTSDDLVVRPIYG